MNSERVPHSLQLGHCPCHLAKSSPQAEHKKFTLFFLLAIEVGEIGFYVGWNQDRYFTNQALKINTIEASSIQMDFYPMQILLLIRSNPD